MIHKVSDSQYGNLRRRLDKVAAGVDQGAINLDLAMSALKCIIEGNTPNSTFGRDMSKEEHWALDREGPSVSKNFSIDQLELKRVLRNNEKCVDAEELQSRTETNIGALGQHLAEWLLEHQEQIPQGWQAKKIIFSGTVWVNNRDIHYIPYLSFSMGIWHMLHSALTSLLRSDIFYLSIRK